MKNVNIEFFLIAQTRVNPGAVAKWLEFLGVSEKYSDEVWDLMVPPDSFDMKKEISDPALLVALAAKRCYKSFEPGLNPNVTKVRREWTEYLDNVLKSRHGSVCEHATYTFAIENVSRVFTAEMNRHRAGVAVSEASMRYIRYDDIPFWMPDSIKLTKREEDLIYQGEMTGGVSPDDEMAASIALKKRSTQAIFQRAFEQDEKNYKDLQDVWEKELAPESAFKGKKNVTSMMRRIIPMGVATGGVWTLNIRALRHIMALRAAEPAEEEMLHVWSRIGKEMVAQESFLLADFSQTPEGYWVPKYEKV